MQLPNGSNASSNSSNSVNTNDTPQTNDEGVQIHVPIADPNTNAKPLGGISNPNKEVETKKKRGLFRKHWYVDGYRFFVYLFWWSNSI